MNAKLEDCNRRLEALEMSARSTFGARVKSMFGASSRKPQSSRTSRCLLPQSDTCYEMCTSFAPPAYIEKPSRATSSDTNTFPNAQRKKVHFADFQSVSKRLESPDPYKFINPSTELPAYRRTPDLSRDHTQRRPASRPHMLTSRHPYESFQPSSCPPNMSPPSAPKLSILPPLIDVHGG
ncbi:hypothetical protein BDZ89DRAFT_1144659 [Hymenopellis radicata]|nr:hypothetical protein BDZ89DRAFT_1144659 [Hymenopellis radicata]